MVIDSVPETPPKITAKTEGPTSSQGSLQGQPGITPIAINRSRHQPERAERFMRCHEAQDVATRAEKLAISIRNTKRRELLSKSRSKIRTAFECTLSAVKPSTEMPETRKDTAQPEAIGSSPATA